MTWTGLVVVFVGILLVGKLFKSENGFIIIGGLMAMAAGAYVLTH